MFLFRCWDEYVFWFLVLCLKTYEHQNLEKYYEMKIQMALKISGNDFYSIWDINFRKFHLENVSYGPIEGFLQDVVELSFLSKTKRKMIILLILMISIDYLLLRLDL